MPAVPMPDAETEKTVSDARAEAAGALKGQFPDSMLAPSLELQGHIRSLDIGTSSQQGVPSEAPPAPTPAEPSADAVPVQDSTPPEPTPDAVPVKDQPGFLADEFKGTGRVVFNHVMAGLASIGGTLMRSGTQMAAQEDPAHREDAIQAGHEFIDKTTDEAYDHWIKNANDNEAGGAAQVLGNVAESVPSMLAGPVGMAVLAGDQRNHELERQGIDPKTAAKEALTTAIATAAGMKISHAFPGLTKWVRGSLQHIASGAVGNTVIQGAQAALSKFILNDAGYKEAAAQIDPTDPSTIAESGIMGMIFGLINSFHGGKKAPTKSVPPPEPSPEAVPVGTGEPPPPPPPPEPGPGSAPVVPETPPPPAAVPAVPDKPSAEPPSDLKAQVDAIGTSRKHVYLSAENVKNLGPEGVKTLAGKYIVTKNFDKEGGVLISQDHSERSKATALRKKNGDDMQKTLGALTGAGEGKKPDQTAVVQGQTPEGAVVKEQMVTPEAVPATVAATAAVGHTPVVTTPEAAQVRRAEGVNAESGPPDHAVPVTESVIPEPVDSPAAASEAPKPLAKGDRRIIKVGKSDMPVMVAGDPVDNKVPVHTIDEDGNPSKEVHNVPLELFKKESIGAEPVDMTKPKEERALERERVAAKRDAEMGAKQEPVPEPIAPRAAAHEGEIARRNGQTDEEIAAANAAKPKAPELTNEQVNEQIAAERAAKEAKAAEPAKPPVTDAQEILDRLTSSEVIPPGKKFPSRIAPRASTISETARAVKALAKKPGVPPEIAADALEAARKVSNLDLKTPEQMEKNQGLSHKMMDVHARELKRVLGNLTDPGNAKFNTEPVQPKAEKLLTKLKKERAKAAEPAAPTVAEKVKAKEAVKKAEVKSAIPDVQDETKVKTPNRNENERIAQAIERYNRVGDLDIKDAHDNLERILHDVYGDTPVSRAFADQILTLAREQREDADAARRGGDKRMSETVEELKADDYDPSDYDNESDEPQYDHQPDADEAHESREQYQKIAKSSPIGRLHMALNESGFWRALGTIRDKGTFASTHNVLDHILKVMGNSAGVNGDIMKAMVPLLQKLREHVADLPIRPVEESIHPTTGERMEGAGLFHAKSNSIQVRIRALESMLDNAPFSATHALLHEMFHAATSYELLTNPNGEFATEVKRILDEARKSAAKQGLTVEDHYGLTDEHEFVAEALTNPMFQDWLSQAKTNRGYTPKWGVLDNVFGRFARAVAKMLGYDGRGSMLSDILKVSQIGMEAQDNTARKTFSFLPVGKSSKYIIDKMDPASRNRLRNQDRVVDEDHAAALDARMDQLQALKDPPPDMEHEKEFKDIAGGYVTDTAKLFRRAVRRGAVETIRRTVRSLTPYDGLVRSALRRGVFGHDDETNTLRNYNELIQQRNAIINKMAHSAEAVVNLGAKLSPKDDKVLGEFQSDVGNHGIHIEKPLADQPAAFQADPNAAQKLKDMQDRWKNLTDQQKGVYRAERDWNEKAIRANRKAGVDVAIDTFTDKEITKAQRQLLYSVTKPFEFDELIGKGKEIDVGDRNDKLLASLKDLASTSEISGDYFHKGRYGEHVVTIRPEGTRTFPNQSAAETYAAKVRGLSPKSKAKVEFIGGKWQVDYKAEYVSMHESPAEADAEVERLRAQGHDVGSVTQKVLSEKNAPISDGMQNIIAEASRKLGTDDAAQDLKESLRRSFVSLMAARSAYAGSKLARRNVGGIKGDEMRRAFATHAQSLSWNTGHMATVFKVGEALGRLREASKDDSRPQHIASQRGRVYNEIQSRLRQETEQYGSHAPLNATIAKLGFVNYMTSVSHALVYMTQNFTTAYWRAAAAHGYGRSAKILADSMAMVSGPAFREAFRAVTMQGGHDVGSIERAMIAAVANHPRFGKWAKGENSPLQQLIDRGIIHTSLSNQIATTAKGGSKFANRVMEWARILPSMADMFNRISSGVAALELHNGDVYKAGDFVKETHIDYSQENKPRMFRQFNGVPFGNSVTMFKSYVTGMSHLLYSHVYDAVAGTPNESGLGGRAEALKTVAGMMVGTMLFAGVQRGFGLEPIRMMLSAYQKLVGDDNEYYSFDNMTRRAVSSMMGKNKVGEVIDGGLPRAFGFDMSSRLGLSDLWLHDPPNFLSMDGSKLQDLIYSQLGPAITGIVDTKKALDTAMQTGRMDDIAKVIPIKFIHNLMDAYTTATQGKETKSGAHITEPSAGAAVSHMIGFRTAEEARQSEKAGTDFEYKDFAGSKKYGLLTTYTRLAPAERRAFWDSKITKWNAANPGHRITVADVVKQLRSNARAERTAKGLPGKDPVQNKLNDY